MQIEIEPKAVGKVFGDACAHEQAAMLNEMSRFSQMICRDSHHFETQLCYIADALDKNGSKLVKELYEFLLLKEKVDVG